MADALRNDLLAVPGIAGAEVDDTGGVAGVRVQLAAGADADIVGAAVRRILRSHGMRPSTTQAQGTAGEDLSGEDESPVVGPPPPPGAPGSVVSFPLVGEHARPEPTVEPALALESAAVEEKLDGVSVQLRTTSGVRAVRTVDPLGSDMDDSVAAAAAELLGNPQAELLGVAESEIAGHRVLTVLMGIGDDRLSGSVVQRGGRVFAMARAVWAALERA